MYLNFCHDFRLVLRLMLFGTLLPPVNAAPLLPRNSVNSTAISVPIVVLSIFILIGLLVMFSGSAFRSRLASWCAGAAIVSGTAWTGTSQPTELTAEQLAGPSPHGATTTPARTRRTRRNRPNSVRSTKSLPVYMKEPGDDEVVIYRGPVELEDTNIHATIVLPSVDEHDHSPNRSLDIARSRSPLYVPLPESAPETPLLESHDGLPVRPPAPGESAGAGTSPVDERGEAPPYFEVVAMDSQTNLEASRPDTPATAHEGGLPTIVEPERPAHSRSASGRLSGLFARSDSASRSAHQRQGSGRRLSGFFSRLTGAGPAPPLPPMPPLALQERGHSRELSTPSTLSATSSRPSISTSHHPTHRASRSGSGSMLSLTLFRTTSHSRSGLEAVTSPSTISLQSISAPLTHTAVRTEFTYPRSGPTSEQMKLISSRESFSRFGMPYGPDAMAFSASRLDLDVPPPVFEAVAGPSGTDPEVEDSHQDVPDSAATSLLLAEAAESTSSSDEPVLTANQDAGPTSIPPPPQTPQTPLEFPSQPPSAQPLLRSSVTVTSFRPAVANPRSVSRASSHSESFATAEESSFHTASEPSTPAVTSATLSLDVSDGMLAARSTDFDALATPRVPSRTDRRQNAPPLMPPPTEHGAAIEAH